MLYPNEKIATLVRIIANQYGTAHTDKFFLNKLLHHFNVQTTKQNIGLILGTKNERIRLASVELKRLTKELLKLCDNDEGIAVRLIKLYSVKEKLS